MIPYDIYSRCVTNPTVIHNARNISHGNFRHRLLWSITNETTNFDASWRCSLHFKRPKDRNERKLFPHLHPTNMSTHKSVMRHSLKRKNCSNNGISRHNLLIDKVDFAVAKSDQICGRKKHTRLSDQWDIGEGGVSGCYGEMKIGHQMIRQTHADRRKVFTFTSRHQPGPGAKIVI